MSQYRLTEYSHGAGCGCKIAPSVLDEILRNTSTVFEDPRLLVGSESRDDAAVFDLGNGQAVIDSFARLNASMEMTTFLLISITTPVCMRKCSAS